MILCINSKDLKTSPELQKDVNLEDLINNHTKYYDSEEEALKDKYVPLNFSVSIRSMYRNLVLETDKEDQKRYYTNLTNIQKFPHKGYDLIMFITSLAVMNSVDFALGFEDVMMKHSQFMPIGFYNLDASIINPIIYTHIIMSDEGAEEMKRYLKDGTRFVNIADMKLIGNIKALTDSLIEVKEETKDEQ